MRYNIRMWRWSSPKRCWNRDAAQERRTWDAGSLMLHTNGALESTISALEPRCCVRMGRWNPSVCCCSHDAVYEFGAGIYQGGAVAAKLHENGALESTTNVALGP